VDHYHNTGESLAHYVAVLREKNYRYERFVLPHDAKKRELGSAKSLSSQLRELGLNKQKILPREDVLPGIQAVREMMPLLWIDRDKCSYVVDAFENYTKEWDSHRGVWKDKPRHDEWSNPMDAVRYYDMYKKFKPRKGVGSKKKSKNVSNVVEGLAM